jgi:hypothetical protein
MLYGDDTIKEQVNTRGWSRPRGKFIFMKGRALYLDAL